VLGRGAESRGNGLRLGDPRCACPHSEGHLQGRFPRRWASFAHAATSDVPSSAKKPQSRRRAAHPRGSCVPSPDHEAHSVEREARSSMSEAHPRANEAHFMMSEAHSRESGTRCPMRGAQSRGGGTYSLGSEAHSRANEAHFMMSEAHSCESGTRCPMRGAQSRGRGTYSLGSEAHSRANEAHSPTSDAHAGANEAHGPANEAHSLANEAHSPANEAHSEGKRLCAVDFEPRSWTGGGSFRRIGLHLPEGEAQFAPSGAPSDAPDMHFAWEELRYNYTLMVRPRRSRREPGRNRGGLLGDAPIVAIENCAVFAVTCLHPVAQCDQILVGIDNRPFEGLRRSRVVLAVIEGHPPPPELFTSTNLEPRQSTAHSVFLESPRARPSGTPPARHFASCADPLPRAIE
jgi:uncharacterized protein DUF3359